MSSIEEIISAIEVREGGATVSNDPQDAGKRTQFGISETSNPQAWQDGVVTEEEARAIYLKKYVQFPKFDQLPTLLQPLCIDWGVVSGPQLVIGVLQSLLKVPIDHVLGPVTFATLPTNLPHLNNLLMGERIKQIGRIVTKDPSQVKFVNGWLNRALEFLL